MSRNRGEPPDWSELPPPRDIDAPEDFPGEERGFSEWISGLDEKALDLWRETMQQLRQTHNDVWNGVRFFVAANAVIGAAGFALMRDAPTVKNGVAILLLAVFGALVTVAALFILRGHRDYYLGVLVRKTLLERQLGFYEVRLAGLDISLPWNVPSRFVDDVERDAEQWMTRHRWRGKITWLLRLIYLVIVALHAAVAATVLAGMAIGYFTG